MYLINCIFRNNEPEATNYLQLSTNDVHWAKSWFESLEKYLSNYLCFFSWEISYQEGGVQTVLKSFQKELLPSGFICFEELREADTSSPFEVYGKTRVLDSKFLKYYHFQTDELNFARSYFRRQLNYIESEPEVCGYHLKMTEDGEITRLANHYEELCVQHVPPDPSKWLVGMFSFYELN